MWLTTDETQQQQPPHVSVNQDVITGAAHLKHLSSVSALRTKMSGCLTWRRALNRRPLAHFQHLSESCSVSAMPGFFEMLNFQFQPGKKHDCPCTVPHWCQPTYFSLVIYFTRCTLQGITSVFVYTLEINLSHCQALFFKILKNNLQSRKLCNVNMIPWTFVNSTMMLFSLEISEPFLSPF